MTFVVLAGINGLKIERLLTTKTTQEQIKSAATTSSPMGPSSSMSDPVSKSMSPPKTSYSMTSMMQIMPMVPMMSMSVVRMCPMMSSAVSSWHSGYFLFRRIKKQ